MSWLPSYPTKRGHFTVRELKILAIVLGYDGNIFQRGLKRQGIDIASRRTCTEQELKTWLDSNAFLVDLDYVFNHYAADYNVKVIKRAIGHLHQRSLTYNDLRSARKSFETSTAKERQLSLSTDIKQVLFALKMVDRVLSPLKLQHILQNMSHHLDESPERLNFYDFLDVVARAERIEMSRIYNRAGKKDDLQLEALFKTPYHQLLAVLDDEYKTSLIKTRSKKSKIDNFEEKRKADANSSSISTRYKEMMKEVLEEGQSIRPSIRSTNCLIQSARAGQRSLTREEGIRALSRMSQYRKHTRICTALSCKY